MVAADGYDAVELAGGVVILFRKLAYGVSNFVFELLL